VDPGDELFVDMRIGLQKAKARIVQNSSELYFFKKTKKLKATVFRIV